MLFVEYYHSALRHLDVCNLMLEKLSSMEAKQHLQVKKQSLKLDIYYLSGYIVETMISYAVFSSIKWKKKDDIETCPLYTKNFKTHKLEAKVFFAKSFAKCDFSGIKLLGIMPKDRIERRMFHEWSEVVRYQNPKTCSQLEFSVDDLRKYLTDIKEMFEQLRRKFYV